MTTTRTYLSRTHLSMLISRVPRPAARAHCATAPWRELPEQLRRGVLEAQKFTQILRHHQALTGIACMKREQLVHIMVFPLRFYDMA